MNAQIFFLHAIEPLHPGIGQGAGIIDLPVAREKPTGWPLQRGSGIKGPLRDASVAEEWLKNAVFGKDGEGGTGAAHFGDARVLLFPLASWSGTFAYVTSPLVLDFFRQDVVNRCGDVVPAEIPVPDEGKCKLPKFPENVAWKQRLAIKVGEQQFVVALDEFEIPTVVNPLVGQWALWLGRQLFPNDVEGQRRVAERLCVVDDNIFSALVRTGTEVIARIRLDDNTKSVVDGALWYEELLPRETVLAGVVTATPLGGHRGENGPLSADDVLKAAIPTPLIQLGGKAGVGRGHCRVLLPSFGEAV